jgi:hypothetical protein
MILMKAVVTNFKVPSHRLFLGTWKVKKKKCQIIMLPGSGVVRCGLDASGSG